MKDEHVKDAAQGASEDATQGAAGLRGPGGARPPRHAITAVFVQLALKRGRNWAVSGIWLGLWASASEGAAQNSASIFI